VSEELSTKTVAKLKAICKENDLPAGGKKAQLIERIENHFRNLILDTEDESISLEEDIETIEKNPEDEVIEEAKYVPLPDDDDVLVADLIEAEIIEDKPRLSVISKSEPATLLEQIKSPKVAAVLISILLAGGGWYWYVNNQLEPFVADDLRYGDQMDFKITDGSLSATDGFVEIVLDNFETDEELNWCKIQLLLPPGASWSGQSSITNGGPDQLSGDDDLLGAVSSKGSLGLNWLTVEKNTQHDFDEISLIRHLPNTNSATGACKESGLSTPASLSISTTTWTEISEKDILSTSADWELEVEEATRTVETQGTILSYGTGGFLSALESIAPGVMMMFSPIEVRETMGTSLIQTGETGSYLGWDWVVIGEDLSPTDVKSWRVSLENKEISDNCLGHARITMWVVEESPWAIAQNVDLQISGKEGDRSACGSATQILGDLLLPEGTLSLNLEMVQTGLERGEKLLDLGRSYSTPSVGQYTPKSSELNDWGDTSQSHLPDNSTLRNYPLEDAVACLPFVDEAVAINAALDDDGYIWRALDNRSGENTEWNISWVSKDPNSGWVQIEVSGVASTENCTYIAHGSHENTPAHNRNEIPAALSIDMLEIDLSDSDRFPSLTGDDKFFTSSGQYHPETRVGHLIVTPDGDYTDWINEFNSDDKGATTLDLSRSWEDSGFSNTLSLAMDATTGQLIGWNLYQEKI
tara:strand:+ start:1433 stop:3526 length:2094 start_codon:yes stop_codon:yes gene_type:complete